MPEKLLFTIFAIMQEHIISTNQRSVDVHSCVSRFRREAVFLEACKACPSFGKSWICPPLSDELTHKILSYSTLTLYIIKVATDDPEATLRGAIRLQAEEMLLKEEARLGGYALGFTGRCPYCASCTRADGAECRHPDKARPSLEALGFDVGALTEELFGEPLAWNKEIYSFAGALFHNTRTAADDAFSDMNMESQHQPNVKSQAILS